MNKKSILQIFQGLNHKINDFRFSNWWGQLRLLQFIANNGERSILEGIVSNQLYFHFNDWVIEWLSLNQVLTKSGLLVSTTT